MVILDILTPLTDPRIDVDGNAAHWMLRTADAALERTQVNWLAMFDSQDLWNAHDARPAVTAWTPYVNTTFRSRKGRPRSLIQARMGRHFSQAWEKAVRHWNFAFRDQAEHFTDTLIDGQQNYADATRRFLGPVGLRAVNFLGAFSMHIMGLCGNEELFDIPQGWTIFNTLSFPAPPIIPLAFRVALDHGLMGILCRDVYLLLQDDTAEIPNAQLDTVLGGVLGFDYAGPPTSYMHIEGAPGAYFLHTHIEGTPAHRSPQALDFHVPMPSFTGTGIRLPVQTDLYAQLVLGDLPVTSGFLRLDQIVGDRAEASLLLLRSDLPGAPTILDAHPGVVFALPTLPAGVTWQLVVLSGTLPQPIPQVSYLGRLWFQDTAVNDSNHAFWSVAGNVLTAQPFTLFRILPRAFITTLPLDDDLFAHVLPGPFPLATFHITLLLLAAPVSPVEVLVHLSSEPIGGDNLVREPRPVFTLTPAPPGTTWELGFRTGEIVPPNNVIVLTGRFWVRDTQGQESQHVPWRVFILSSP